MTLERLDDSIVLFDLDRFPLKGARMLIDRSDTIGARLTLALSLSLSLSHSDYAPLRVLSYALTDAFVLFCSVEYSSTLVHLENTWYTPNNANRVCVRDMTIISLTHWMAIVNDCCGCTNVCARSFAYIDDDDVGCESRFPEISRVCPSTCRSSINRQLDQYRLPNPQ